MTNTNLLFTIKHLPPYITIKQKISFYVSLHLLFFNTYLQLMRKYVHFKILTF